jgi:hypothetical protein
VHGLGNDQPVRALDRLADTNPLIDSIAEAVGVEKEQVIECLPSSLHGLSKTPVYRRGPAAPMPWRLWQGGSYGLMAEGLLPLADHRLSRDGKNVHTKRVRRDRRGHARGLFHSIRAGHWVPLSMSERVTVQGKIGRSATTNLLDERINPYQSIGGTLGQERASLYPNGRLRA